MQSEFKEGRWEEIIPNIEDNTFNLIYTDPPYGMNYLSNIPGDKTWNKSGESIAKFDRPILNDGKDDVNWENLAEQCYRVLKPNSYLFLHCNLDIVVKKVIWFEEVGFNIKGMIPWNKKFSIGGDIKGSMKRDWEPIIYMAKGKPKLNSIEVQRGEDKALRDRISEISDWTFQLPKSEKIGFPTQKPLALCKQIIELASQPEGLVLDPFAGSGTIPLACRLLNRRCLAIEADHETYEKFVTRAS